MPNPPLNFVFLTSYGLNFLMLEEKLFLSQKGQILLGVFILLLLFWFKGAFKRYKNWILENNKKIKWYDWFRF